MKKEFDFVIVLILFCFGFYIVTLSTCPLDFSKIPGDNTDNRLNIYFYEHGFQFLTGKVNSFWDAPIMYPDKLTMALSDTHLGTLPIYALLRGLNFDIIKSFQLLYYIFFLLDYFVCFWALRKLKIGILAAGVGSYIFTFSLPIIAQLPHMQLMPRYVIPLYFLALCQLSEKYNVKYFMLLVFSLVLSFYISPYIGFFLCIATFAFLLALLIVRQKGFSFINFKAWSWQVIDRQSVLKNYFSIKTMAISLIGFAILLILMYPYFIKSLAVGMRPYGLVESSLPRLQSYFIVTEGSYIWGDVLGIFGKTLRNPAEHRMFSGFFPTLIIVLFPFIYRKTDSNASKIPLLIWLTGIITIILTLYIGYRFSLYIFIKYLPGFGSLRSVARIVLVQLFLWSFCLAYVFDYGLKKYKKWVMLLLIPLIVLDQLVKPSTLFSFPKSSIYDRSAQITAILNDKKPKVFAYLLTPETKEAYKNYRMEYFQLDAMIASLNTGIPTINGYSGACVPAFSDFFMTMEETPLRKWMQLNGLSEKEVLIIRL